MNGEGAVAKARRVAREAHRDQRRKDGHPYFEHPIEVARLLEQVGCDEHVLVAAVLHDAVEDSALTVADLRDQFGDDVAELVSALSDDPAIDAWQEKKDDLRGRVEASGPDAGAIYVADKVVNLRELTKLYARHGEDSGDLEKAPSIDLRIGAWRKDLAMATRLAVTPALTGPLATDLDVLERLRAEQSPADGASGRADQSRHASQ